MTFPSHKDDRPLESRECPHIRTMRRRAARAAILAWAGKDDSAILLQFR